MPDVVTRWSMLAAVVEAQLNFDMPREEFVEILRILHDYEAHEHHVTNGDSLIGLQYEVQDVLWDHLSAEWGLAWPDYEPPAKHSVEPPKEIEPPIATPMFE